MTRQYGYGMRALLFDVFGTCVDWRASIIREAERFGLPPALAQAWRDEYQPQLETVRSGARPWVNLDVLHRIGLDKVLKNMNLILSDADREELTRGWHRLDPWPDVVEGLTKLKATHIIAPCSNGHIAQSVKPRQVRGPSVGRDPRRRDRPRLQARPARLPRERPRARPRAPRGLHGRRAPGRSHRGEQGRAADGVRPQARRAGGAVVRRRSRRVGLPGAAVKRFAVLEGAVRLLVFSPSRPRT